MPTKYDGKKSSLPIKPEIPAVVLSTTGMESYDDYAGPIEPGMVFAWEPFLPWARELIIVAEIAGSRIGTYRQIGTYSFPASFEGYKDMRWNDISRFREAVAPTRYNKFPKPGTDLDMTINSIPMPSVFSTKAAPIMDMKKLADEVAEVWTDLQYPYEFNTEPSPIRHFTHALMHVLKACGKLAEMVDAADHQYGWKGGADPTEKALADIIISTQRMAEKAKVDLGKAVTTRLSTLRDRYLKKMPEDNSRYDESARILFEEIHGEKSWDKLTPEAQFNWREVARKHFLRTTQSNVARAEKADTKAEVQK